MISDTLLAVIQSAITLLILGVPAAYMLWMIILAFESRNWPTANGEVIRSQIKDVAWRIRGAYPRVVYQFTVDMENYVGKTICFGREWNRSIGDAEKAVEKYKLGTEVVVHYHPNKPTRCTLETRVASVVYLIAFGILWAITSTLIALISSLI